MWLDGFEHLIIRSLGCRVVSPCLAYTALFASTYLPIIHSRAGHGVAHTFFLIQ